MRITVEIRDCEVKLSPNCTKTFEREPRRGRPHKACVPCRELKPAKPTVNVFQTEVLEGKCPCGETFEIRPGRGRKPSKCVKCREAGRVYRRDDDGVLQEIQADQLRREDQERKRQAGHDRALLLFLDMQKLIKRRQVTV